MTYTPRPGDIGLTKISGAGGAAIRLGQWLNADAAALEGGWHLFQDGRWPGDVTPGDLYRLWRSRPEGAKA